MPTHWLLQDRGEARRDAILLEFLQWAREQPVYQMEREIRPKEDGRDALTRSYAYPELDRELIYLVSNLNLTPAHDFN